MVSLRESLGMSLGAWETLAGEWELPRYRGRQIFDAIHRRGVRDYARMIVLPEDLRERLARELPLSLPEIVRSEPSSDGSIKYGLKLSDGALIEAVFMPGEAWRAEVNEFEDARAPGAPGEGSRIQVSCSRLAAKEKSEKFTVCLSSQTGCAVDCAFCVTGRLGAGRNLTAGEDGGEPYAVVGGGGRGGEGVRGGFR